MALKLITGPANSAKAGAVLDAYRERIDEEPLLVVPRWEDVSFYQRELALGGVVFGGAVVRFAGLWRELAQRAGFTGRRIGPIARQRLVSAAVEQAQLRRLAVSARSPGFTRAVGDLVAELQAAMAEPVDFRRALDDVAGEEPGRRRYGEEVSSLYEAYRRLLDEAGRVDDEGYARGAIAAMARAPDTWGRTPVFLYGFDDLTRLQLRAIEVLAGPAGADVTVSLTYESGRAALAARDRALTDLRPLADEEEPLPALADHYAPPARGALHHLERTLFEADAERRDPGDAVRLLESGGLRAEMELIGSEVLRLMSEGTRADQIAVMFRAPDRYVPVLSQVFAAYGIPVALDDTLPVIHTALGRGLVAVIRCALASGTAEDLLAYLRTPGLASLELVDGLEARIRREGIVDAPAARAAWERRGGRALEEVDRLKAAASEGAPPLLRELAATAEAMFSAPFRHQGRPLAADEEIDARVHGEVRRALAEMADLAHDGLDGELTSADVLEALTALSVRRGDASPRGGVVVADPLSVRARRFSAVIVGGLQEGVFPRPGRPDPFLSEEWRRALAERTGLALRRGEESLDDERFLFYSAVSRPTDFLALSYRTSDEEGNPAVPSFFVDDVRALFTDALHDGRRRRPLRDVTWSPSEAPTAGELDRALRAAQPAITPPAPTSLSQPAALAELREPEALSAGALEDYADCPFNWLVRRLRPGALEAEPEPVARGSFAHAVLEGLAAALRERTGSARVTGEHLPLAQDLLDELLESERGKRRLDPNPRRARVMVQRVRANLRRHLALEARSAGPFEPVREELNFGFEDEDPESLPPLALGDGSVLIRGRIDRVDIDPVRNEAIVRDYKSSTHSLHRGGAWTERRRLQVALYMLAVRRLLDVEPVGGVYQPVLVSKDRDGRGRGLLLDGHPGVEELTQTVLCSEDRQAPEDFEQTLADAEAGALQLAGELRAGHLVATPEHCGYFGGCAYPGICRRGGS